ATFSVAGRLCAVSRTATAHAWAVLDASTGPVVDAFTTSRAGGAWADVAHGARRLRANLTPSSVHLQDALRLGVGLALATATIAASSPEHGLWVASATLTVIKPTARATGRTGGQAVAGPVVGFAAATAIITVFGTDTTAYLFLLPLVVAGAIYANVGVSFAAG